jgi:DNA repair exonuclease SbcCD ATPase subunit
MDEKITRERQMEELENLRRELNEEKQHLAQVHKNIEERRQDLEIREAKLQSIMPLVPSVRELQGMGVTFDIMLPFVTACHERSVLQNMNLKDAAFEIAKILRAYKQFEVLQNALDSTNSDIEKAQKQLKMTNMVIMRNQQAIETLTNLYASGMNDHDITNLCRLVSMWNQGNSPAMNQGNGSSRGNNGFKWDVAP